MLILNTLQIVLTNTILSIVDVSTDVKKAYDYLSWVYSNYNLQRIFYNFFLISE